MGWITGNRYLSEEEMQNNAKIIWAKMHDAGWSLNAVSGMLGNMETESTINPGIWESLKPFKGGYGLVQWTPYTNYSTWAGSDWQDNGDKELARILWEFANGKQYYKTNAYPLTASEFAKSTNSPEYLAYAFMYNYERPGNKNQPQRKEDARKWYDFLTDPENPPDQPDPDPEPGPYIPPWLLFKFKEKL